MISILFWNIAHKSSTYENISRLTEARNIDILFIAEPTEDLEPLLRSLNAMGAGTYRVADGELTKVRCISRLPESDFFPHFTNRTKDLTIWNLSCSRPEIDVLQVAVVHLIAKSGGVQPGDQLAVAVEISRQIASYEDRENVYDTMLIGDLNMNPYDLGVITVSGLHGTLTASMATKEREWRREEYRKFYNPMWGFFGDRTPGPAGTYFWESSVTSNHHWHILDQVLVRPSLIDRLIRVIILDSDGTKRLVDAEGKPTKKYLSDHLPILCELDI